MLRYVCLLCTLALCLIAADNPTFAVASIHRAPDETHFFVRPPGNGAFTANGTVARMLIMLAYNIQESQISGGENWLGTAKWNIAAKADDGAKHTAAETREMLQNLLIERFALRTHRETQERAAYVLTVAKGGPKFKPSASTGNMNLNVNGTSIFLQQGPLSRVTQILSSVLDRPVVDRTGLTGTYDLQLRWDDAPNPTGGVIGAESSAAPGTEHGSIFTALQEQLGLHLASEKAPVEILVIDQIKLPSDN